MKQVAVIALLLFMGVVLINGIRLTFAPGSTCNTIPLILPKLPPSGYSTLYHHDD